MEKYQLGAVKDHVARAIAESADGEVKKGTKAERPYPVALGRATAAVVEEHRVRALDRAGKVGVVLGPELFVFSDDGGVSHWNLGWPSHAWRHYSAKAGVPPLRLHDLRHTAASQMLMAGIPISVVAERLGCTEVNILRTYRHFIPGSDQKAADLMDLEDEPPRAAAVECPRSASTALSSNSLPRCGLWPSLIPGSLGSVRR